METGRISHGILRARWSIFIGRYTMFLILGSRSRPNQLVHMDALGASVESISSMELVEGLEGLEGLEGHWQDGRKSSR